jgi:SPP1 family predicted phage head-tail adaptor
MDKIISVFVRSIVPPSGLNVDFNENFTEQRNMAASIETVRGEEVFDGTGTVEEVTHKFVVKYQPNITFENWVSYKNKRYRIVDVENQNERNRFYIIRATIRGVNTLEVNKS